MWSSLVRRLGRESGSECKSWPARRSTLRLEGLDERATPGSAAAGVLGTCMTGPTEQAGSLDTGGVGQYDPSGGAAGGVLGDW
jgi:hypothetical protein